MSHQKWHCTLAEKPDPDIQKKNPKIRNPIIFAETLTVFNALDQILEVEPSLVLTERFQGWDFHHRTAKKTENRAHSPPGCTETGPEGFVTTSNTGTYRVYSAVTRPGRYFSNLKPHHEPPHHLCTPFPLCMAKLCHPQTHLMFKT